MDAQDRKRKRRRQERRERNREAEVRRTEAAKTNQVVKRVLAKPRPAPMDRATKPQPAYRVRPEVRSKMPDLSKLNEVLQETRERSSQKLAESRSRLFDNVPAPLEHVRPDIKPIAQGDFRHRSTKLSEAFQAEPRSGSVHPREDKDPPRCKDRPKDNRPRKRGGGSKKRFVPWC